MNARRKPTLQTERELWQAGYQHVAGLDEAGRGAWAGLARYCTFYNHERLHQSLDYAVPATVHWEAAEPALC